MDNMWEQIKLFINELINKIVVMLSKNIIFDKYITKMPELSKQQFKILINNMYDNKNVNKVLVVTGTYLKSEIDKNNNEEEQNKIAEIMDADIILVPINDKDEIDFGALVIIRAKQVDNDIIEKIEKPIILTK